MSEPVHMTRPTIEDARAHGETVQRYWDEPGGGYVLLANYLVATLDEIAAHTADDWARDIALIAAGVRDDVEPPSPEALARTLWPLIWAHSIDAQMHDGDMHATITQAGLIGAMDTWTQRVGLR